MDFLNDISECLIVLGDFNIWIDIENNQEAKLITTLMSAYGLSQMIFEQTHRQGHTLDHVYANTSQIDLDCSVLKETFGIVTDHFPCLSKLSAIERRQELGEYSYRKLKDIDLQTFRDSLQQISETIKDSNENFSSIYKHFKVSAQTLIDNHAPVIHKTCSKRDEPKWIDVEYKLARARRRKSEKKWKRNGSIEDKIQYITQRNHCTDLAKAKKQHFYANIINNAKNQQQALFNVVEHVLDRGNSKVLPTHTNPTMLANRFNRFYIDKIDNLRNSIPYDNGHVVETDIFSGDRLFNFEQTTEEEVLTIIREFGIKTSPEDPIPVSVLKSVIDVTIPGLVKLINKSFEEGSLDGVKHSVITPLLKKPNLDSEVMKNYRPVSNLVFFSKLIERVALKRLDDHMLKNNLQNNHQYGYKKNHSTETMMLGMLDNVLDGFDNDCCTVVIFLDLSAAFDTIDIQKLLQILKAEIGLDGNVLKWFESFMSKRTQRVKILNSYSDELEIKHGTPQGSVLGPRIFEVYVRSQPKVFQVCKFGTNSFADDSNGSKTFTISFQYNILKYDVPNCLAKITKWMNQQCLKINPEKTEIILFHPKHLKGNIIIHGTLLDSKECIRFSDTVKNVGVLLDNHLELDKHINKIVSHCFKLLKDIGRIRSLLSQEHTEMLVHAVISSRIDYCNSLFVNMKRSDFFKLQKVQNSAARLVCRARKRQSARRLLSELHWLPVESRCIYKTLLIVFKCIHGICSKNLVDCIEYKQYNCRPNDFLKLKTKPAKTKYGKRMFSHYGPRLWNDLPLEMRSEQNIEKFKKALKTFLFDR